jgi:hypothetical protein
MSSLRVPKSHYGNGIQDKWRLLHLVYRETWYNSILPQFSSNFSHSTACFKIKLHLIFKRHSILTHVISFCFAWQRRRHGLQAVKGGLRYMRATKGHYSISPHAPKRSLIFPFSYILPFIHASFCLANSHFPWWSKFSFNLPRGNQTTVGYARTNVNGSGT